MARGSPVPSRRGRRDDARQPRRREPRPLRYGSLVPQTVRTPSHGYHRFPPNSVNMREPAGRASSPSLASAGCRRSTAGGGTADMTWAEAANCCWHRTRRIERPQRVVTRA